jgi:hypothetical protein
MIRGTALKIRTSRQAIARALAKERTERSMSSLVVAQEQTLTAIAVQKLERRSAVGGLRRHWLLEYFQVFQGCLRRIHPALENLVQIPEGIVLSLVEQAPILHFGKHLTL